MYISPKLKTFYKISAESGYPKVNSQPTEANFTRPNQFQKLIKGFRESFCKAGNWVKEDVKESIEGLKLLKNEPVEAVKVFGKNVAQLVAIAELKFASAQRKSLRSKSGVEEQPIVYIKQQHPNPRVNEQYGQRTQLMVEENLKNSIFKEDSEGNPMYGDRRIGGQNTPNVGGIDKCVYPGSTIDKDGKFIREVIVVDFDKDPIVQSFYKELAGRIMLSNNKGIDNITKIYDRLVMPMIDLRNSEDLAEKYKNQKVLLGVFMKERAVVCRHSAVLFALMFKKLKEQGIIPTHWTCEIMRHSGTWKGGEDGMHVYCKIYTGKGYHIVDPVQQESGPLEVVARQNPYAAEGDLSNPFEYGQSVKVLRGDNNVEIWSVGSIIRDPENHINDIVVVQATVNGNKVQKSVPMKALLNWQQLSLKTNSSVTPKAPLVRL